MNYFYDTNIIIYYLNQYTEVEKYFTKDFLIKNEIAISIITRIELLSYPNISETEELKIYRLLNQFKIIFLTNEVEQKTIKIKRKYNVKLPDAVISASSILTNSTLLTRNIDDFKNIDILKTVNPFNAGKI